MTDDSQTPTATPPFFQFGLLSLLVVTTAVAATCSLAFSMSNEVAIPLLVAFSVLLTAVLITVIVYGSGYQRTFCIGAVVPFGVLLFTLAFAGVILFLDGPGARGEPFYCRMAVVCVWVFSIVAGGVCMAMRRLVEKRPASRSNQQNTDAAAKVDVALLMELLKHNDEHVRQAAAEALRKL